MGQVVFDWSNRELALHMELRLKTLGVDPSQPESQDIDEEARATVATSNARISFQSPGRRIATDDTRLPIGFGHVSAAMDDLAIVTMAVELGDRFAGISISTAPQRQAALITSDMVWLQSGASGWPMAATTVRKRARRPAPHHERHEGLVRR